MKNTIIHSQVVLIIAMVVGSCSAEQQENYSCQSTPAIFMSESHAGGANLEIDVKLNAGTFSTPPSFALWAEFPNGATETIYVTCKAAAGSWDSGEQRDGLPIWNDKRIIEGLPDSGSELDAITCATPTKPIFTIHFELPDEFFGDTIWLNLEANLTGDFNEYYPPNLGENGQPSVIWNTGFILTETDFDHFRPARVIGRSHPTGADAKIYADRRGITTALDLINGIDLTVIK